MKIRLISATVMLVAAAAGCMTSTRIDPGVAWVNPGEHRIVQTAAGFKTSRQLRVKYTDAWQTEEYALFNADGQQCEMIYAEASKGFTVALDYRMPIEEMVATWNLNSRQNLVWGPLGRIDHRFGIWFYRTFEHRDLKRPCIGLMVEWDQIYEDPQGRPGKVLFGYFCGAGGEKLEDPEVRALIHGFSVRTHGESTGKEKAAPLNIAGPEKPSPIAAARGGCPSAGSGNPGFPYMFARYYSMNNGGRLK